MNQVLLTLTTGSEPWLDEAVKRFEKKVSRFQPLEIVRIKSKGHGRDQAALKIKDEEELLFKQLGEKDFVIVFDEHGKSLDSLEFSEQLSRALESGKARLVFVIGGAFGLGEQIKKRANLRISLSKLTFSHHVALAVALEQIYRAWTIRKGQRYHNG